MKLSNTLAPDRIELDLSSTDKISAIEEMIALIGRSLDLSNYDALLQGVLERESVQSTGVDRGVAIPHTQTDEIDGVVTALGISRSGLEYQSLDGQPVYLVFLILSSRAANPAYLSVLSRTARIFDREEMKQKVMEAATAEEIIGLIRRQEPV